MEVDTLSKQFGGVLAIDQVSLAVSAGEALGLIGPNGAGKTTLLKTIAGVYRPDQGTIHIAGERTDKLATYKIARRGVGLVSQVPRPFPALSVRENVRVGGLVHGRRHVVRSHRDNDEIIERCGLASKASRPAGTLGLLDLKRLELARSLSLSPQVLLLDEMASGLVGAELDVAIDLVRQLHADGMTVVVVEHVERVIRSLVKRVLVLDWGKQIAEGTPAQVAADPKVRAVYLGEHKQESRVVGPRRAEPDASTILRLDGVTASYGRITALREIDLEVQDGEVVAVLGANGAGKTTMARVISGLSPIDAGGVYFAGNEVSGVPAFQRARAGIAHCQEGRRIFGELTVHENLRLAARHGHGRALPSDDESTYAWACRLFPMLKDRAHQRAGTLSGGQQQMLAIGRALMAHPKLIVCDEISLGLAPVAVNALYEALAQIRKAGVALVVIEQNVERSLNFADRVYVLDRGHLSYTGAPEDLMNQADLVRAYFGEQHGREQRG